MGVRVFHTMTANSELVVAIDTTSWNDQIWRKIIACSTFSISLKDIKCFMLGINSVEEAGAALSDAFFG